MLTHSTLIQSTATRIFFDVANWRWKKIPQFLVPATLNPDSKTNAQIKIYENLGWASLTRVFLTYIHSWVLIRSSLSRILMYLSAKYLNNPRLQYVHIFKIIWIYISSHNLSNFFLSLLIHQLLKKINNMLFLYICAH